MIARPNSGPAIESHGSNAPADPTPEEWRPIAGANGLYSVSNLGRVRSEPIQTSRVGKRRGRILSPCPDTKGYLIFPLYVPGQKRKTTKVHRVVAEAFLGPRPEGMQINHRNGDKTDNRVENLEYVTCRENIRHCWNSGLHGVDHCRGEANRRAKLTAEDVRTIRQLRPQVPLAKLAAMFGVTKSTVSGVARRTAWQHV